MAVSVSRAPRHVRHVRESLKVEFDGLIDMSDKTPNSPEAYEQAFLSRALAAKAARRLTGCTSEQAADTVIDGRDDYGIDAVAVADGSPEIWLIQAKWSDSGRAGCNTEAANKLVRGFKQLDDHEFGRFNERLQALAPQIKSILNDARCKVNLVVALMGDGVLSSEVEEIFQDAARDFNLFGRTICHSVLSGEDFFTAVREDIAPQPISITATMSSGWHWRDTPYEAYYGLVGAVELAEWYADHGDRLFSRNVRKSLGRTRVNNRLVETLRGAN